MQQLMDVMLALGPGYVLYIDAGAYVLRNTTIVHPGTVIIGECWPLLVAQGDAFNDMRLPIPLLQVGQDGDVGSVEIQQLLFTSAGTTAGLIAVEWNILADAQGSAAMWGKNSLSVRILISDKVVNQDPRQPCATWRGQRKRTPSRPVPDLFRQSRLHGGFPHDARRARRLWVF